MWLVEDTEVMEGSAAWARVRASEFFIFGMCAVGERMSYVVVVTDTGAGGHSSPFEQRKEKNEE